MGDFKHYNESGGFDEYLYHQVGDTITASNGVQGKVINADSDPNDESFHEGLPLYSNTSEVYFKRNDEGDHEIEQARVYKDRRAYLDLDWGHGHGTHKKGVVHVQEWRYNSKGEWVRNKKERDLSNAEIERYGELILLANPNAKLR